MLIDVTSFTSGPRQIENAVATPKSPNQTAVAERINGFIDCYQPVFLRMAVGYDLANVIDAYSRFDHNEPDEKKEKLIALLREPFADYVFFYILRVMNVQSTITGLVQLKSVNSYVSPLEQGVLTWNRMTEGMKLFAEEVAMLGVNDVAIDKDLLTCINNLNL